MLCGGMQVFHCELCVVVVINDGLDAKSCAVVGSEVCINVLVGLVVLHFMPHKQ